MSYIFLSMLLLLHNHLLWCYRCNKAVEDPILRLSIHFEIEDPTGTKEITAFEEQAEFLLDLKFDALLTSSLQENGEILLKEELEKIVGEKQKFEIRTTEYNLMRPDSPFTAGKIFAADHKEHKKSKHT
ncbi:hypothetical protein AQUCO_02100080v1 [Aquilegia coerulea]|uniref:Replication factor A C-terminal domain-containing protein n=1 Tax=Aquilegia coerulea TaxID=218851 RepID=A0A2G5DES7_AQUCA|nr:hypothetical protein AQUCO_02100080v1 [Aquilegia coerulea]